MTIAVATIALAASACALSLALANPTAAQTTVPSVTTANPGYLFPNDRYTREREERHRNSSSDRSQAPAPTPDRECSADALPPAERRAMETRFAQINRAQGREAAMAWANEQGRIFAQRLVGEGVCTPDGRTVR